MPLRAVPLVVLAAIVVAALGPLSGGVRAQDDGQPAAGPAPAGAADNELPAEGEETAADAARTWPVPEGFHLSSYASRLCARVDRRGALDSGAGVLQLVDAESGEPLPVHELAFGKGPMLWAGGRLELPLVEANVRMLAVPLGHLGDERVRTVLRVELLNHAQDLAQVRIAARLSPGGGDRLTRPADALDFAPGTRFGHEDGVITRDGSAILAWVGPDPEVALAPPPAGAGATACTLTWDLPVQPNTARYLDITLAGAAHQPVQDEAGWRQALASFSYVNLEEQLAWQTDFRGEYVSFESGLRDVDRALRSGVHVLRSLGEANRDVVWLTDRPYGFPPTDAAVPAEIVGVFYEWGLGGFAETQLRELVRSAPSAGQQLAPDRRTALVAGLVSAVRLSMDDEQLVQDTAAAIRALIVEEAAVEPWLDPAVLREDLATILRRADPVAGEQAAEALPALRWAEPDEGPVAAQMLAARQALAAGDRLGFWEHYSALLAGLDRNGMGSMRPGGDLDGRFPIGFMCLSRAMLIDDHGRDLRLLAGTHADLLPERDEFDLPWLPTVFGKMQIKVFRLPGSRLVAHLQLRQQVEPNLIYVHMPAPYVVSRVVDNVGGKARLMPDGSLAAAIAPSSANLLNFTVAAREEQPEKH
ncbi:MAG TPA: hypothetical protein VFD43_00830 [Planctomycetota bacterium]|nr:hypothetical protein [Planctomycetota bacterium]